MRAGGRFRRSAARGRGMIPSGGASAPGTASRSCRASAKPCLPGSLAGDPADDQARYIEAAVRGVIVASILRRTETLSRPKFAYKLAWLERLQRSCDDPAPIGAPVVLAGDYNMPPTELDIYPTRSWTMTRWCSPKAARLPQACRPELDGCPAGHAPGRAHLHLLALCSEALGTRRRAPPRSPSAVAKPRWSAEGGRRRSRISAARTAPAITRRPGFGSTCQGCRERDELNTPGREERALPLGKHRTRRRIAAHGRMIAWKARPNRPVDR